MKLHRPTADSFVPDGSPIELALGRATHVGVGAHQDDLEFMAFHGITECFHHENSRWFGGVTCTNGAGSSRTGAYRTYSDSEMCNLRVQEQRAAAVIGRYSFMLQLAYPSAVVKELRDSPLVEELAAILKASKPEVVYTHNLADKHDTHVAVAASLIHAIRTLPQNERPARLLGCEVWRGLDWLGDGEKVVLDVSGYDNLAAALNGVFDSQIAGGKRYDLATYGRRAANATFFESHQTDASSQLVYAMDLTPLVQDESLDPIAYTQAAVDRFREDIGERLGRFLVKKT